MTICNSQIHNDRLFIKQTSSQTIKSEESSDFVIDCQTRHKRKILPSQNFTKKTTSNVFALFVSIEIKSLHIQEQSSDRNQGKIILVLYKEIK